MIGRSDTRGALTPYLVTLERNHLPKTRRAPSVSERAEMEIVYIRYGETFRSLLLAPTHELHPCQRHMHTLSALSYSL